MIRARSARVQRSLETISAHRRVSAAAALALLLLTPAAHASRRCLDASEAARTWPSRALAKDDDGCWTYDHHPPRPDMPVAIHEPVLAARETRLMDRWVDAAPMEIELRQREAGIMSQAEPSDALTGASQFALFVALVLATVAVAEIATVRPGMAPGAAARRWAAKSRR
jgi:hypothetical protein